MPEARRNVAVLISGQGSNLQALIDAAKAEDYPAEIALVISNKPDAYGLKRAEAAGIPTPVSEMPTMTYWPGATSDCRPA